MEEILFADLNLSEEVLNAVTEMGFTKPSAIQAQAIPIIISGKDVIGQAQTGTGKTAAFGVPAVEIIDANSIETQILILCPTRELAMQVSDELVKLSKFKKKVRVTAVFGGASIDKQIQSLRRGSQVVVGTPGRIMDHLDRGTLHLEHIKMMILDEADEMLDMGFRDDIEAILSETPAERQTVFFSATMAKPILDLAKRYQKTPEMIKIQKSELTVDTIDQRYVPIKAHDKITVMSRLIDFYEPKLALIFCNTKRMVDEMVDQMQGAGFAIEALHGDMRQMQRTQVMNKFRQGSIQILAATDVAARGIDVDDVEMVINFDLPMDTEYYVHRIGRTGRAGRKGMAFSLVTRREINMLKDIERFAKTTIKPDKSPSLKEIENKKREKFLQSITDTINNDDLSHYTEWIEQIKEQGYAPEMIAAALMRLELHQQFLQYSMPDEVEHDRFDISRGNDRGTSRRESSGGSGDRFGRGSGNGGGSGGFMTRMFVSLGRNSGINPRDIVGAIAGESGISAKKIGKIDMYDRFTFVEVEATEVEQVTKRMKNAQIKGFKVSVDVASDKDQAQAGAPRSGGGERREGGRSGGGERKPFFDRDGDRGGNSGGRGRRRD